MPEELTKIKDRFRIDSLIAYGGMARVYKGTDLTLARTVAVKVLSEDLAKDPNFLLRFRREAQAAAALTHPNIVAVYDTGAEAGLHYIVMEYVEGTTLQDILIDEGPLPPERAAAIGADVGRALAAAHSKGIVHRDVKPGNIIIGEGGVVKVTDFGIAKAATAGALTQVGSILGTVAYLSPEQARGEEVDSRSDIYSLGAMVYQMLTGRAPFAAETLMEMVNKLNNQIPTPPSRLNPLVPPAMEGVVMKALAKDPARRFQDAGDMAEQLLLSLNGDPSATAAYVAPAVEVDADRTLVAPAMADAALAAQAPAFSDDDYKTRVIETAAPAGPGDAVFKRRRAVIGGAVLLALLAIAALVISNMGNPVVPLTSPTPTPTLGSSLQVVTPTRAITRPPPTTLTTVPVQPSPQPPVTEPSPPPDTTPTDTTPPSQTPADQSSPAPLAGAAGAPGVGNVLSQVQQ